MAKGKRIINLKDSVPDSEIVRLGEVRNRPTYLLPDGMYGITGEYNDYSLVKKRIAYRTGTVEDGENKDRVIEYAVWDDYPCYTATLEELFNSYARILNLSEFKSKKMKGEISELVAIHKHTQDIISDALKGLGENLTKEQAKTCELIDTVTRLETHIKHLEDKLDKYKKIDKEIDHMYQTIKEKTTIIVNRDKPKEHKVKLEEN